MQLNRKRLSKEQKFNILSDHLQNGTSISELARLHGIHPITIYQWKRLMGDKPKEEIDLQEILKELNELKKEKEKFIKVVGELSLENQCLQDINEFLKKKYHNQLLNQQKNSSKKKKGNTKK